MASAAQSRPPHSHRVVAEDNVNDFLGIDTAVRAFAAVHPVRNYHSSDVPSLSAVCQKWFEEDMASTPRSPVFVVDTVLRWLG